MTFPTRHLPLPGGRTLDVRAVTPADVEGLVALYEGLGEEDLYRRFFQARIPPLPTIENMTSVESRGGFRLIAEIECSGGERRIVGECGYELLRDRQGELAITVSRDWRGWLGPYLLDTLVQVAALSGVDNMQADVLLDNHRMLALVGSRGYATMDHSYCPAIVRALIGTTQRVPTWPGADDRPRVLVEVPGALWHAETPARAAGMQVLVCPGPLAKWSRCPVLAGGHCPLAEGADVIVDAVPAQAGAGKQLLEAHERFHSGIPVCVEPERGSRPSTSAHLEITSDMDDTAVVALLREMTRPRTVETATVRGQWRP